MKLTRAALAALLLCSTAQALPTGEWWVDFEEGAYGILEISKDKFVFELTDDKVASGFEGPVAEVREPSGDSPGRIIIGPVSKGKYRFEVVWYYPPEGPRGNFYCELEGFKTLSDAKAAPRKFEKAETTVFLERDFFKKVQAYPPLPEPSREVLIALLKEALERQEADPNVDSDTLMQGLMIDKGYHPSKSREPFEASVGKFADDPAVAELLDELEGNSPEEMPEESEEQQS